MTSARLSSLLLGWEGNSKENVLVIVNGMVGSAGFVRQQGIEAHGLHHVPSYIRWRRYGKIVGEHERCVDTWWPTFRHYAYTKDVDNSRGAGSGRTACWDCTTRGREQETV